MIWKILRTILAILYAFITILIAMVASFADGGTLGERALLTVLHPLAALGLLGMAISKRLSRHTIRVILGLLGATVVGDLIVAGAIAGGAIKGDWEIPLILAMVPVLGILYGLFGHRTMDENQESTPDENQESTPAEASSEIGIDLPDPCSPVDR